MDISPATAVTMNSVRTQNEMATRVLKKALDLNAQQGADLAQMVAQAGGVGQKIDTYA